MFKEERPMLEERCKKFLERLRFDRFREYIPLTAEYCNTGAPCPWLERTALAMQPIRENERWGKAWENAWFHFTGEIPEAWQGEEIVLQINLLGETLFFDNSGCPMGALTGGSVFDIHYFKELFWPPAEQVKAGRIDLWAEATVNFLWGVTLQDDTPRLETPPEGSAEGRVLSLRLGRFNREAWALFYDFEILRGLCSEVLSKDSYRYRQLLFVLNRAIDVYADDPANATAARAVLAPELARRANDSALTSFAVGHAHIDVGWLWQVQESIRKAARTFSSQLDYIKRYPGYVFGASQPQLYEFVKLHYPALYEKIKAAVKAGSWELQGAMWVEADANLPCGEALTRQMLIGKNFFMDEFGIEVKNLWLPDVFGYSAALPQIIRKARCDFFLTQKISWNQFNQFPFHTFRWRGIDGTEVLTHFPPENNYNAFLQPRELCAGQDRFSEADKLPGFVTLFGIGDGGGGPSEAYLERGVRMQNLEGCPKVKFTQARKFFELIAAHAAGLPEWDGELYLEKHRGTLTTQSRIKRGNRQLEQALLTAEFAASASAAEDYPKAELLKLWKTLLINQFHDILPGSSIREVYETTERRHQEAIAACAKLTEDALKRLARPEKDALFAVNTLSFAWHGLIDVPEAWGECGVADEAGNDCPVQTVNGKHCALVTVPAAGSMTFRRTAKAVPAVTESDALVLENELIRYEFNDRGELISAFDKEFQREVLPAGSRGNRLQLFADRPNNYDAWDVDYADLKCVPKAPDAVQAGKVERGAACSVLKLAFTIHQSRMEETVILRNGSRRLDFVSQADWHERHRMLRVEFAADIHAETGNYEIQYGYLKRPLHENTSFDMAKFEVPNQRYMDLSEHNYGAALLNDCKYGAKLRRNTLSLSLLRAPLFPDRKADQGEQFFTYSFLPHPGALPHSAVMPEADALNRAPVLIAGYAGKFQLPFALTSDNAGLECVKRAEKSDDLIFRAVERCGESGTLEIRVKDGFRLYETDLIEWEKLREIPLENGGAQVAVTPFEIKTFALVKRQSGNFSRKNISNLMSVKGFSYENA